MDLLYTVQRLAEARAATSPPARGPPPRTSLRARLAHAAAAADAHVHNKAHLDALYPLAGVRAQWRDVWRQRRDRRRQSTRQQAEDECWALFDEWWDPAADVPESDSEEDDDEAVATTVKQLNAEARALWARHAEGVAATTPRYVEGMPVRHVLGPPTVPRRLEARCRASGLPRCAACERAGLARCSRMMMGRAAGDEPQLVCERCRRTGESCEEEKKEEGSGKRGRRAVVVMDVVGSRVEEVEVERFALPMKDEEDEEEDE